MTIIGLGLIVTAWLIQAVSMTGSRSKLNPAFLFLYATGALVLVVENWSAGPSTALWLNFASAVLAGLVLFKLCVPLTPNRRQPSSKTKKR